jgi:hypothetical protein
MTIVTGQEPYQEGFQPRREAIRQLLRNRKLMIGSVIFLILVLIPIVAVLW